MPTAIVRTWKVLLSPNIGAQHNLRIYAEAAKCFCLANALASSKRLCVICVPPHLTAELLPDGFPRQVEVRPPKVAVRRRLRVQRSAQPQLVDDSSGAEVELLAQQLLQRLVAALGL